MILYESNIINEYIDERFPHPQLMPGDPVDRARVRLFLLNFEKELFVHVAALEARGLKFDGWATPGANPRSAAFDFARVTARRAERRLCALPTHGRTVRPLLLPFVNRLSDLLWLFAREAEQ